jgi:A/G-specific adenine glycosylase
VGVAGPPPTTAGLARLAPGAAWVTVDRMTERALPTVMRKIIAHAVQA